MRKDLEDLWNYYLLEVPIENTKKEEITIQRCSKIEKVFHSMLTEEQLCYLSEYDSAVSEIGRISERHAFIKGFMFATRFLFQALSND